MLFNGAWDAIRRAVRRREAEKAVKEICKEDIEAFVELGTTLSLPRSRWGYPEPPHKADCFFYSTEQDMGATHSCCEYEWYALEKIGYIDECPADCNKYIERKKVYKMIAKYVDRKHDQEHADTYT